MAIVDEALRNPVGLLFIVIALGLLVGRIPLGNFRMGGSGVLLVGLFFGHMGYLLPKALQTLGVVLFVYSVGLRAGPYILESLKKSSGHFVILAVLIVSSAGGLALLLRHVFNLPPHIISGLYAGAMTSTPALAAAMEAVGDAAPSVSYGVAYPFGILGVILFVQIIPYVLRVDLKAEAQKYQDRARGARVLRHTFKISNANLAGRSIAESLPFAKDRFRIVRIMREGRVITPSSDMSLRLDDLVLVVSDAQVMDELRILLGETVDQEIPESEEAKSDWVVISSKAMIGKKIGLLEVSELHGIIISRVRRESIEFTPKSNYVFESGDAIRVSGTPADVERFTHIAGRDPGIIHETDILSFALWLAVAVVVGLVKIPLPGGLSLSFGVAGGPLVVGLVVGYFGRFGKLVARMPQAANLIVGELGLYLFLAVAGCAAGEHFVEILRENGLVLIFCGVLITVFPILVSLVIARFFLKMDLLTILGMVCGGMTSTPALGVLTTNVKSDLPSLAYTGIYPLAVLLTTLAAQLLAMGSSR